MTEKFLQARKYLKAISEKTLWWYKESFRAYEGARESTVTVNARIVELSMCGVKPVGVDRTLKVKRCVHAILTTGHTRRTLAGEHQSLLDASPAALYSPAA